MRASKERCEEARQAVAEISEILEPLRRENGQLKVSAQGLKRLENDLTWVGEFLNVAKRKLPTEAAYDKDLRRRAK